MGVRNGKFYGTKASINIWKPNVADPSEFSLSQTWLVSGVGTSRNTIEAGWQVWSSTLNIMTSCSYAGHHN